MEKRYTIGVMIGNANSPHTMNLMQGIFHAAKSIILAKIRKMIMIISSM